MFQNNTNKPISRNSRHDNRTKSIDRKCIVSVLYTAKTVWKWTLELDISNTINSRTAGAKYSQRLQTFSFQNAYSPKFSEVDVGQNNHE